MADDSKDDLSSLPSWLSALRALPVWIFGALTLAGWATCYILLTVPTYKDVDLAPFRQQWGFWIFTGTLTFTLLAVARFIDMLINGLATRSADSAALKVLKFVRLSQDSWWHLAKQPDDSTLTQIALSCQVSNTGDRPVGLVNVRMTKPAAKLVSGMVLLPDNNSPYHSRSHAVPAHGTAKASVHLMAQGALGRRGRPITVTIGLIDQFGHEYRVKWVDLRTGDRPATVPLGQHTARLKAAAHGLFARLGIVAPPPVPPAPMMPWTFEDGSEYLAQCRVVLQEEKRNYEARGRRSGKLGSLSVGLQSEPNNGWTTDGDVPKLLWDEANAAPITSPNLNIVLRVWNGLSPEHKANVEGFLLTLLSKNSGYADIGYFIFLALHRMGRTIDALTTARAHLAGDKVFGYSNVLGALSAVVSHEHFAMEDSLFSSILIALEGDTESDFRLRKKINFARVEQMNQAATYNA